MPILADDLELIWAPYDRSTYDSVLEKITRRDVVLEIGAGDLRLSMEMAQIAESVYAIEIQATLLPALDQRATLPENLHIILGDARHIEFPQGVRTGVLLMRHCTRFTLYSEKIIASGAHRLITNARWGMGVEVVDLTAKRLRYGDLAIGWYACHCGAAGFKEGPVELLTGAVLDCQNEVTGCPACEAQGKQVH